MSDGPSRFYNSWTRLWYRVLRHPIHMRAVYDNKLKSPDLTVVFLHGISATSATWRTTLRELTKNPDMQNVRFITLDLLGFGKSLRASWLSYDYAEYERALDHTLKKLRTNSPVVLVGHSMGGLIIADYVANHQPPIEIAHLIFVSPPILQKQELAKLPDKVYIKSYSSLYRLAKKEPAMEVIANFVQRFSNFSSKYFRTPAFQRSMDNIILNPENYRTFCKLKCPGLLIHGRFDPLVIGANLRKVAAANPKYLRCISVVGHHDITAQKRSKILIELKKVLRNQNANL